MKVMVHLSKELRAEHKKRAFPVKVGDKVRVAVGSFKGTTGKVLEVGKDKGFVRVESVERTKSDGSKLKAKIHSSNVEIIELDLEDKWRKKTLKRK
ncbi:MAG: 50S ribosomal protein L24 [Candidatus Altiarchaeota archaeon]|nr:50S ribosomal protein L24 [Candidatus Altiarchaeota archaeon]